MRLQLKLFVDDVERSLAFYTGVLDFRVSEQAEDGFTALARGDAAISLNRRQSLPADHPVQARSGEPLGRGVEVVLYVEDVQATYEGVVASGWPRSSELLLRPWGERDFRVLDPDGYYLRISNSATQDRQPTHGSNKLCADQSGAPPLTRTLMEQLRGRAADGEV